MSEPLPDHVTKTDVATQGSGIASDLATQVGGVIVDIIDKMLKTAIIEAAYKNKVSWLNESLKLATDFASIKETWLGIIDPATGQNLLTTELQTQTGYIENLLKAGIFGGVGSTLANIGEGFLKTGQLAYYDTTLRYNVSILPRLTRLYNWIYHPTTFSSQQAWKGYRQKVISEDDFFSIVQSEGFSLDLAKKLKNIWSRVPGSREGFWLWCKGLLDEAQRNGTYFAEGWDPAWNTILTENYYAVPTLRQLQYIADTTALSQTWTLKQLKKLGFKDEDAARLWDYLDKRPVMTEQRAVASQWLWRYTNSRCNLKELIDALKTLDISTREINLLATKAQLQREDELINEWVEILIWRFRIAVINEETFMKDLENLGITHEKANLIVETQKAMGYLGGYETET